FVGPDRKIASRQEVVRRSYRYDGDGLLLTVRDRVWGTVDYSYDPAERLLSALRDRGLTEEFEYDAGDNLVDVRYRGSEVNRSVFDYGPGNRLLGRDDTRYEYDLAGRLVRRIDGASRELPQTWTFDWDALGQLRKLRRPDEQEWQYKYDAFGRRVAK